MLTFIRVYYTYMLPFQPIDLCMRFHTVLGVLYVCAPSTVLMHNISSYRRIVTVKIFSFIFYGLIKLKWKAHGKEKRKEKHSFIASIHKLKPPILRSQIYFK